MGGNDGNEAKHEPRERRRRETCDRVTMDWCYAIGCERLGDRSGDGYGSGYGDD